MMMMKNFLVLVVASLLILPALQSNARRLTAEEKPRLMAERQLVSQTNNSGRKANVAANTDAKDVATNKNTAAVDAKIGSPTPSDGEEKDDDTNKSYGQYGNSNGSTPDSHHYYTNDQKPPAKV